MGPLRMEEEGSYRNPYANLDGASAKVLLLERLRHFVKERTSHSGEHEVVRYPRHCCHDWSYNVFNYGLFPVHHSSVTHYHVHEHRRPNEKEEKKPDIGLGIALAILAIGASFLIGMEVRTVKEAEEDISFVEECQTKRLWDLKEVKEFFAENKSKAYVRLGLKVSVFAAAAIGSIGAFTASAPLLVVGLTALVVTACFMAFNWGWQLGDEERNSNKASRLMTKVQRLA